MSATRCRPLGVEAPTGAAGAGCDAHTGQTEAHPRPLICFSPAIIVTIRGSDDVSDEEEDDDHVDHNVDNTQRGKSSILIL